MAATAHPVQYSTANTDILQHIWDKDHCLTREREMVSIRMAELISLSALSDRTTGEEVALTQGSLYTHSLTY